MHGDWAQGRPNFYLAGHALLLGEPREVGIEADEPLSGSKLMADLPLGINVRRTPHFGSEYWFSRSGLDLRNKR